MKTPRNPDERDLCFVPTSRGECSAFYGNATQHRIDKIDFQFAHQLGFNGGFNLPPYGQPAHIANNAQRFIFRILVMRDDKT